MAEGRQRLAWNHTATLCAIVRGLFDDCKPVEFHPYERAEHEAADDVDEDVSANWAAMEALVVKGRFA